VCRLWAGYVDFLTACGAPVTKVRRAEERARASQAPGPALTGDGAPGTKRPAEAEDAPAAKALRTALQEASSSTGLVKNEAKANAATAEEAPSSTGLVKNEAKANAATAEEAAAEPPAVAAGGA
ncbi:unnamed protein product, partial [Prorocentrum cordatum]